MKRPLPPTFFFASLVIMVILHVVWPAYRYWGFPVNLIGVVPVILGVVLNVQADRLFKTHRTTVKPFEQSTTLVRLWPFSASRNPMYLGLVSILLGGCLLLGTVSPLLSVFAFALLMDRVFIRVEEQMLEATFGDEWRRYRSEVRRWL